jgi:nitrate/nitrite-specific signal transduction histidine kinase
MPETHPDLRGLLDEMQQLLDRAREKSRSLEAHLQGGPAAAGDGAGVLEPGDRRRLKELEERLGIVEEDRRELAARLVDVERQTGRLMSLYVATYQIHATLDPEEVQQAIAEVATNLLGADSFALILSRDDTDYCEIAVAQNLEDEAKGLFHEGRYLGGDPMIDATLEEGRLWIGTMPGSRAIAAAPLTVEGIVVGALVVLRLLKHRATLSEQDRELIELMAAHAASAIFAAEMFTSTHRRLKTLEGLVTLGKDA